MSVPARRRALPGRFESLGLPLLVVLVLLCATPWAALDAPESVLRGPDDLMRVQIVRAHLDGRALADPHEPRLAPPEGTDMLWSPLASLPLLGAVRLTEPFLGRDAALTFAPVWVPPVLGACFVAALLFAFAGALPLAGRSLPIPALFALAPLWSLGEFLPGRVDHHGLGLILSVLAVGAALRALAPRPSPHAALWMGALLGVALTVSLESLVTFVALGGAFVGAYVIEGGVRRALAIARAGAACLVVSLAASVLTVPAPVVLNPHCDQLSLAHFAALGVLSLGALCLAAGASRLSGVRSRALAAAALLGAALAAFAFPDPVCLGGPYARLHPGAEPWLAQVAEAHTPLDLFRRMHVGEALGMLLVPLAGVWVLVRSWRFAPAPRDSRWLVLGALSVLGLVLISWQVRGAEYAHVFAFLGAVPAAALAMDRADRVRPLWRAGALWLAYPLGALALAAGPPLLLPTTLGAGARCVDAALLERLNDPAGLGARPLVLAAPIDDGPLLLYRTRHSVLAAGYLRSDPAIADQWRLFGSDASAVAEVVRGRGVDALIVCPDGLSPYAAGGHAPGVVRAWVGGRALPAWLSLDAASSDAGVLVYRVDRARLP